MPPSSAGPVKREGPGHPGPPPFGAGYSQTVRRALVAFAALALLAAACGRDNGGVIGGGTTPEGGTTTTAGGQGGIDPMEGASTAPISVAPTGGTGVALLSDVRAARHEGFDRVVFEFTPTSTVPGYEVRYVERPVLEDGSGREVAVDGTYVVVVRMTPASGVDLSGAEARPTYAGPERIRPGTPEVVEVVRTGDFEAQLTWAVGLVDRVDFRVLALSAPPRLIIDFRNH